MAGGVTGGARQMAKGIGPRIWEGPVDVPGSSLDPRVIGNVDPVRRDQIMARGHFRVSRFSCEQRNNNPQVDGIGLRALRQGKTSVPVSDGR